MTELPVAVQIVHAHLEIIVETPTVSHPERIIPQEFCCILSLTVLCTLLGVVVVFGNSIKTTEV